MSERFRQLELEELDEDQRRAIAPVLQYAGGISGPFNATLRSAKLTETSFALGNNLLFETVLSRRLTEMAILIRARLASSQLEWFAHHARAREEGLPEDICEALRQGRRPGEMGEDEAALFDFSIELLKKPAVTDATFARAKAAFGERGVVELSYLLGFYGMISLVLKMAEVGAPDGSRPLEPMEDPFGS